MDIYISPMAGVTDYAYRKIMEKFNPDLMFTEMVNSSLLMKNDEDTLNELLKCDDFEKTGTQVFGNNKKDIVESFLKLEEIGFNKINLNMGCPQPKIIKNGAGCSLLLKEELVEDILYTLKCKLSDKTKISIKIRSGYKDFNNPEYYFDLSQKYKLDFICIHGRTQDQMYSGEANWDIISKISEKSRDIKLIGNGDIFSKEDFVEKTKNLNINGVMLARGIIGNPWLISDCKNVASKREKITLKGIKDILIEHLYLIGENKNYDIAPMEINKFVKPYFKNFLIDEEILIKLKDIIMEKDFDKKVKKITKI